MFICVRVYSRDRPVYHAGPVRRCPERVTYPAPPAAPERAPGTADHVLRHHAAGPGAEPVQQGRGHHRQRTAGGDPCLERLLLRGTVQNVYCLSYTFCVLLTDSGGAGDPEEEILTQTSRCIVDSRWRMTFVMLSFWDFQV